MSCLFLSKAFCYFTLSSAVRKGGERERHEGAEGQRDAGLTEQQHRRGPVMPGAHPLSLPLSDTHERSKSEHPSPVVTTDLAGPSDVASSILITLPCQKVAIV